jgi:hypothetical protein
MKKAELQIIRIEYEQAIQEGYVYLAYSPLHMDFHYFRTYPEAHQWALADAEKNNLSRYRHYWVVFIQEELYKLQKVI